MPVNKFFTIKILFKMLILFNIFFTFNYFLGKLMKKLYLKTIKNFNSKNFIEIMKRSMDVYRNECFGTFYIPFCSKFRTFRSTNAAIFYFTSSHRSPRMNNFQLCSTVDPKNTFQLLTYFE